MKAGSNMSLFNQAWIIYKEGGLFKLFKACIKYPQRWLGKLRLRYYQLRGRYTFNIGSSSINMFVTQYTDAWELYYVYETERSVWETIIKELKPNDVFWDVGAHLGFYSLIAANCSGVEVAAFEPHPTTVKRFRKNIELNKKSNIKVINLALSDSEGRSRFNPIELDSTIGRARLTSGGISGTIEVETSSGDKLIENSIMSNRIP